MVTQVVTSLETWCRYEKIPFYLQRERYNEPMSKCPSVVLAVSESTC